MMRTRGILITALVSAILLSSGSLWARKTAVMPDNFGSAQWAASNWTQAVNYLKYIADSKIRGKLEKVPEDQRVTVWENFWKGYDPTKTTEANEFRDKYFERIRYANENFGATLQYGWETERGEAWVRLGAPRWTDRYPMNGLGRDTEVWQYWEPYEIDLVFYDRTGLGDFYLLNPASMVERAYLYGN